MQSLWHKILPADLLVNLRVLSPRLFLLRLEPCERWCLQEVALHVFRPLDLPAEAVEKVHRDVVGKLESHPMRSTGDLVMFYARGRHLAGKTGGVG